MSQLLVCGNRYYTDYSTVKLVLDEYTIKEIVCGDCKGADKLAVQYSKENGIECKVFTAHWDLYNRAAGPIRNKAMIDYVGEDAVVIAFDASGKGTTSTVNLAKKKGLKVRIID